MDIFFCFIDIESPIPPPNLFPHRVKANKNDELLLNRDLPAVNVPRVQIPRVTPKPNRNNNYDNNNAGRAPQTPRQYVGQTKQQPQQQQREKTGIQRIADAIEIAKDKQVEDVCKKYYDNPTLTGPFDKECVLKQWERAGCKPRGTFYPKSNSYFASKIDTFMPWEQVEVIFATLAQEAQGGSNFAYLACIQDSYVVFFFFSFLKFVKIYTMVFTELHDYVDDLRHEPFIVFIAKCESYPKLQLQPTAGKMLTCSIEDRIYRIHPNSMLGSGGQGFAIKGELLGFHGFDGKGLMYDICISINFFHC